MAKFRIFIEETSYRLMWRDVDADTRAAAVALAHEALDGDEWPDWECSSSDASLEVREDLTEAQK